jgi:hypothetical protein
MTARNPAPANWPEDARSVFLRNDANKCPIFKLRRLRALSAQHCCFSSPGLRAGGDAQKEV